MKLFFGKKKRKEQPAELQFLMQFRECNKNCIPDALENQGVCALMQRAVKEYNDGEYKKAIWTLECTVPKCETDCDRAMCACFLALFYYDEADYEKARRYVDAATGLKPNFKAALNLTKKIYDIVNECRNDKTINPDMIKLRDNGKITVSDLDILMHNIDVDEVMGLLDHLDRSQFDRKLQKYRSEIYTKKRSYTMKAYQTRLSQIMNELEECAPREFLTGDPDQREAGQKKQEKMLENVQSLCDAQKELIMDCAEAAKRSGRQDVAQKLLLFSTWHFYLAAYAKYTNVKGSGEFFHTIHRTMFPYTQEIENTLRSRFPGRNVIGEIGAAARDFGTKLATLIRDAAGKESAEYDRIASDMTWLFLDECGMRRSDPLAGRLYDRLYSYVVGLEIEVAA